MYEKAKNGWLKHLDFIVLDLLCLQLSFSLSYFILQHLTFAYSVIFYRYQAIVLVILCSRISSICSPSIRSL